MSIASTARVIHGSLMFSLSKDVAPKPHCTRHNHSKPISVDLNLLPLTVVSLTKRHALRCCAPLHPHSPNGSAAPRFSPTRFILPSFLQRSFRSLIASRL